ncbi:Uncharacterised protein [Mycobacteroides abscessus subsp. abscessus]|nr:Uncharacterised protein [Mycobacteroides abscessus subsp. abscessus]SKV69169.1 Uncharacterised protein [Mycobacteroides abscessus subsp. abscessus]
MNMALWRTNTGSAFPGGAANVIRLLILCVYSAKVCTWSMAACRAFLSGVTSRCT